MDGCLGLIRGLFIFALSLLLFSYCGTMVFFNKPAPQPNVAKELKQENLDTEATERNRTTKEDLNESKTIKVLLDGKPIADPNEPGKFLFIYADRSKAQNQTEFIGRHYDRFPADYQDWIKDGKLTIEYEELGKLYPNPDQLAAIKNAFCREFLTEEPTYFPDGRFNFKKTPSKCP